MFQKIRVVKLRMLRWMRGVTRRYKIENEDIWEKVGVTSGVDKLRKVR